MEDTRDIHWNNQLETIMAEEGEKCRGLAILHQRAEQETSKKNTRIALPVIILSTLSGTASVGQEALFGTNNVSSIIIGLVSISVGILNTISSYFNYAKKSEAHRISNIHYSKLFSWVNVELSLPRNERIPAEEMLKYLREQMERLAETSPSIPPHILEQFKIEFEKYTDVSKPVETNGLSRIKVYRETISSPSSSQLVDVEMKTNYII